MSDGINDSYSGRIMDADKPPVSDTKMSADEEYVRSRWEFVAIHQSGSAWSVFYGSSLKPRGGNWSTEIATVWRWAYEATVKHEQAIADLREEIAALIPFANGRTEEALTRMPVWAIHRIPFLLAAGKAIQRAIAREKAALDELLRGWKGTQ